MDEDLKFWMAGLSTIPIYLLITLATIGFSNISIITLGMITGVGTILVLFKNDLGKDKNYTMFAKGFSASTIIALGWIVVFMLLGI